MGRGFRWREVVLGAVLATAGFGLALVLSARWYPPFFAKKYLALAALVAGLR
jgi:hypothetical protein